VRAYNPWPGAFTTVDGQTLLIWEAWPLSVGDVGEPGTILSLTAEQREMLPPEVGEKETLAVQTGEGLLAILRLQRAGRRSLTGAEFIRGQRKLFGRRLGL
jgi:methionyl-tRNA formyltransferase